MEEEEYESEAIFDLQHSYNSKSKYQTLHETPPSTSTPNADKATTPKEKVIPKIKYNLVDDLKNSKSNISLFS